MKSDYSKESITEFLSRKYGEDIRLFPIKEGQESQAYWFSRGGREYVVRINSNMEGFKKDKYAYEHFRSDRVPIPEVVETTDRNKQDALCKCLDKDNPFLSIIFCRTNVRVDKLEEDLARRGYNCAKIHSDVK